MSKILLVSTIIALVYIAHKKQILNLSQSENNLNRMYDGNFDENFFRNFDNVTSNKTNNYQT